MAKKFLIQIPFDFSAKPAVAHNNKKLIIDIINSNRAVQDPRIFAGCLQLLMNTIQPTLENGEKTHKLGAYYKRLDDKEMVIESTITTFKKFFFYPKLPDFELVASQTINFLYKMCSAPDLLCQGIIHDVCKKLKEISQRRAEQMMDVSENGVESSQVTEMYIPNYLLPRIIFIFGYIAEKELVYLDNDIYLNIKYREELKKEKNERKTPVKRKTMNLNASASESLKRLSTVNSNEQEQDEAYMGATAEDQLVSPPPIQKKKKQSKISFFYLIFFPFQAEVINNICENQLIGSSDCLLHHFLPILIEVLSHPAKYANAYVQRAAVLTLMRFMVVSANLCAERIAFLMNILKKTKDPSMKCNIIVGLADLTGRFANTIEPWIPNFYTTLLETDETVRLTTLKMLSYVILQGIIRVTGQIADIATCVVDDNAEIQCAAKEFFRRLVESKDQEYYKIIPDIVSRLSPNDFPLAEDKFRASMKFLLELIQKDRQVESLVEKLCGRFRNTNTERQWRDIAYCLSLLNHSEKTMRKLIDHLPNYKDKVQYDEIYECFKTIISNANKQVSKVELKNLAKDLDTKLTACLQVNENGNVTVNGEAAAPQDGEDAPMPSTSQPAKKDKKKTTSKAAKQKNKINRFARAAKSSDDDDDDDDDFLENSPPPQPAKGKGRGKTQAAALNSSTASTRSVRGGRGRAQAASQSSEESDDEPPAPTPKGRRGRR